MMGMFNVPIKVGDVVAVFSELDMSTYSNARDTVALMGTIKEIEELPTGRGYIKIEHYTYSERIRADKGYTHWKDEKVTKTYWNHSVFNFSILKDVMPEYFL